MLHINYRQDTLEFTPPGPYDLIAPEEVKRLQEVVAEFCARHNARALFNLEGRERFDRMLLACLSGTE